MTVVHWDDAPGADLAIAVGAGWACLRRLTVGPGESLTLDADDRESVVWLLDRDAVLVRRPGDVERSVRGESPITALVFAAGARPAAEPGPAEAPGVVRPSQLPGERLFDGESSVTRYDVGAAAGAFGLAVELVDVAPGRRSFPALDPVEVSVVLRGAGQALIDGDDPWVTRGSVVGRGERFVAGPQGLRVLSFRERHDPAT